ncbi:MAG: hypothetical protein ACQETI_14340 [Halobacteriota archaeon]
MEASNECDEDDEAIGGESGYTTGGKVDDDDGVKSEPLGERHRRSVR